MSIRTTQTIRIAAAALFAGPLASCVTVKAPDKPIDINLNVDIKQQVVVQLQQDVQRMIQQNPQAFPPAPASKP